MSWTQSRIYKDLKYFLTCLRFPLSLKGYYFAWTGHKNVGDDALETATYSLFHGKAALHDGYLGKLGRILGRFPLFKTKYLIMGGGTHILENDVELDYLRFCEVPKRVIFGTGVSDPAFLKDHGRPISVPEWVDILNKTDYIGVRGPVSRDTLLSIGVKKEMTVLGDPALYYAREIKAPKKKKKRLGVNFGDLKDFMWGKNQKALSDGFAEFLKLMLADGWEMEMVPTWGVVDLEGTRDVIRKAGAMGKIPVFSYDTLPQLLDKLEEFDVFIGVRLHAVIFAYCANTPGVMIDYRTKGADFMDSIDMGEFNIRTDAFDPVKAKHLVEKLYADLDGYRTRGERACLGYRRLLASETEKVLKLLK